MISNLKWHGQVPALCGVLLWASAGTANAQIIQGQEVKFDFTKQASVNGRLDYSDHDKLTLSDKGLGPKAIENSIVPHAWFQSTEPIALGFAWTPTAAVTIHAHVDVDFADIGAYSLGSLYVRCSPDAAHWSQWQVVMGAARPDKTRLTHDYDGKIVVPFRERKSYFALLAAYYKSVPEMAGDEEAAVRWIVKNDPRYFEKHIPFAGYIQFLFETPLTAGQHIKSMNALVIWTLPGLHISPKRERTQDSAKQPAPWQFRSGPPSAKDGTIPGKL